MTTDETRDELARMDGWTLEEGEHHEWCPDDRSITTYHAVWIKGDDWITCHPMPPTLDAANAAVPEGWEWKRYTDMDDGEVYAAWRSVGEGVWADEVNVPDHGRGHEMDDLYALALACRRAMEEKR